jgi:hypothetical protein
MSGFDNANDTPIKFYGHCAYPNCRRKSIDADEPFVSWHGVDFSTDQVFDNLSPIGKVAEASNASDYRSKFGHYSFTMELHPKCAAEWGMHLISDALKIEAQVGRKLRNE